MLTLADLQPECIGHASVWTNREIGDGGAGASTSNGDGEITEERQPTILRVSAEKRITGVQPRVGESQPSGMNLRQPMSEDEFELEPVGW